MKDTKELTTDKAPPSESRSPAPSQNACRLLDEMTEYFDEYGWRPLPFSQAWLLRKLAIAESAAEQRGRRDALEEVRQLIGDYDGRDAYTALDMISEYATGHILSIEGNALPTEAPSSPSDLSARKTEDQQELTRAAPPRSPDGVLDELRDAWLCCARKVKVAIIDRALRAAESRGRERGIEEAAWHLERLAVDRHEAAQAASRNNFHSLVDEHETRAATLLAAVAELRALTSGASAAEPPSPTGCVCGGLAFHHKHCPSFVEPPKEAVKSGLKE